MYNPYAELKYVRHIACWFPPVPGRWIVYNQDCETVAVVVTSTANHMTEITITLVLGEHKLPLEPVTRPSGTRTALRWVCRELNNGHLWLSTRLALEREARLLGYDEPKLLACEHARDFRYCLRLLTNLPGLVENWPKR